MIVGKERKLLRGELMDSFISIKIALDAKSAYIVKLKKRLERPPYLAPRSTSLEGLF